MSKRLDILGARIFGASICHARKYLQPFQKCPNVWTKSPNLAIMHKRKPHIIRIKTCICAFCYFINFLHTFLDIFKNAGHIMSIPPLIFLKLPIFFLKTTDFPPFPALLSASGSAAWQALSNRSKTPGCKAPCW